MGIYYIYTHIHSLTDGHRIEGNLLSLVRIIYVYYFYVPWKNKVRAELLLIYIFLSAIPAYRPPPPVPRRASNVYPKTIKSCAVRIHSEVLLLRYIFHTMPARYRSEPIKIRYY